MSTVAFRVSLHGAPDEARELVVDASLHVKAVCEHAAALFDLADDCADGALGFTLGGELICDDDSQPDARTAGELTGLGLDLVVRHSITFRVSLHGAPDEARELVVAASLHAGAVCERAAALFDLADDFAKCAVELTLGGESICSGGSLADHRTAGELAALGCELLVGSPHYVAFSVSLYADPDEVCALEVGHFLSAESVCERAAALFDDTRRCALHALTFKFDGKLLHDGGLHADTAGALAARRGELVVGFRPLDVTGVMPST